jgi:hypothetical protein
LHYIYNFFPPPALTKYYINVNTSNLTKFIVYLIIALSSILITSSINAQTISIDTIFITDDEIFPFGEIELITGLTLDGEIELKSDTSLIRVIIQDVEGAEFMVLEVYPLISDSMEFSVSHHCDESCFLDEFRPYSLIIRIIDARLELKSLYYSTESNRTGSEQFRGR